MPIALIKALNIHHDAGQALEALARLNDALDIYKRVYAREDKHWGQGFAHFVMGNIYAAQGRMDQAQKAYRAASIFTTLYYPKRYR